MRTRDKVLCWTYGVIAFGALIATWSQNLRFFAQDGNGGVWGFVRSGYANPAAASITNDILFVLLAAFVLMIVEARRLGIGYVWAYMALSLVVALSVAFPLFLLARQLRVARAGAPSVPPAPTA
ncbi:MAG: hypothetical protein JWL58_6054 [Streptosporangiaceae bacterium]|jgi:hypothetical protein|nr:hypothetical protein [Streptosporangiaceae bacterium]